MNDLHFILPELILSGGAMFVLMLGVFTSGKNSLILTSRVSALILLGALVTVLTLPTDTHILFSKLYRYDNFGLFVKAVLIFSAALVLILSFDFIEDKTNKISFEYPILILTSLLGMLIMTSANDFLTLYLGLELQSLSVYILAATKREDKRSTEAAIKYFVLGALASGILLYGITLIYGYTGSTNFTNVAAPLVFHASLPKGVIVGLVLVMVGFAFKISAAPFHMWTPDVYEGVPTPVTAFFAIVPKLAAATLFIRVLMGPFAHYAFQWQQVIIVISIISMLVGAYGAIWQSNIKRLLAYSSISHVGYMLLGILANNMEGVQSVLNYMVIYILSSVAIFGILLSLKVRKGADSDLIENIDDFKGLAARHPVIALLFSLLMFSMIGLPFPPFPGFFAKFFVFTAAIEQQFYTVAVIGILASVVAAYYYLRIVKIIYFDKPDDATRLDLKLSLSTGLIIGISTALSMAIFISPALLMDACYSAASSLF